MSELTAERIYERPVMVVKPWENASSEQVAYHERFLVASQGILDLMGVLELEDQTDQHLLVPGARQAISECLDATKHAETIDTIKRHFMNGRPFRLWGEGRVEAVEELMADIIERVPGQQS
jgi:hypothetical protein